MEVLYAWLGFLTAIWVTMGVGVGYIVWRYVYKPWQVIRADIRNLHQLHTDLEAWVKTELGQRKALAYTEEELALIERRTKARRASQEAAW